MSKNVAFRQGIRHKETRTCAVELYSLSTSTRATIAQVKSTISEQQKTTGCTNTDVQIKHRIAPSYLCDLFRQSNKRYNLTKF